MSNPADETVRYCPECGRIGPIPPTHETCCPDSFGMSMKRWQAEKMERVLDAARGQRRAANAGEPAAVAWEHEFTDPHNPVARRKEYRRTKPGDYERTSGDVVRPLVYATPTGVAADESTRAPDDLGARYTVEFDGFTGTVIGSYKRLDGEEGVVMQQDGCKVVHVYRRKWLKPVAPPSGERPSAPAPEGEKQQ